jgi:hypothetical protein
MNKLTITEKVFVPVSVDTDELNFKTEPDKNLIYEAKSDKDVCGYWSDDSQYRDLLLERLNAKEETNKYVLSKKQMEQLISDAFEAGANREYQERNYERRDYVAPTKEEYINSIL